MVDQTEKPGSQTIGGLIQKIVNTRSTVDGTANALTSKPRDSATTTPPRTAFLPTGERHGGHGSGMPTSLLPATAIVSAAPPSTLQRDPGALLPQHIASRLDTTWETNNQGHGWDGYVTAYEMTAPITGGDLTLAIEIAEAALRPATPQKILAELTRLRALTVSRDQATLDLELIAAAYTDELSRYPADAVVEVLRDWPRSNRFWPSMAELVGPLDRMTAPRKALWEALRRGYKLPETSPYWIAPSDVDKAAVDELLEKHGYSVGPGGRVRPPEREPLTREIRRKVYAETKAFRLPDENDPRVQARLREMGALTPPHQETAR